VDVLAKILDPFARMSLGFQSFFRRQIVPFDFRFHPWVSTVPIVQSLRFGF